MADEPIFPKRYGVFDAEGAAQSFWSDDLYPPGEDGSRHRKIPAEAVEITEAQYRELINNQPWARLVDGEVVVLDPPPPPPPPVNPFDEIKAMLTDLSARVTKLGG